MLRSDLMTQCDVYLQPETGFKTLERLGEMGCVQFLDRNSEVPPFKKQYVTELCRCAEMERKLRYILSEMEKGKIRVVEPEKEPPALQPNEMIQFENMLEKWEDDIKEMSANQVTLLKNFVALTEMEYVLDEVGPLVGDAEFRKENVLFKTQTLSEVEAGELGGQLIVTTGTVARNRSISFEMMLWRISRGKIYYRQANNDKIIKDPLTGVEIRKVAFIVICQGEILNTRMQKVYAGYRVNIYPCPKNYDERMEMLAKVGYQTIDLEKVIQKTRFHRNKVLKVIAQQWDTWSIQVKKAKAIYHNLNLFRLDITKNCLIGQCWVPKLDLQRVQRALKNTSETVGTYVLSFMSETDTKAKPPTFHRTNKFTHGFQALINAYGDSTYREINPGMFTVVTFPFLFALMFGDIGHGLILVIFASWMCIMEKKYMAQRSNNEIWNIFFGGRYVILMLGFFSIYAGFVYNDIFSRCMNFGDSYWMNHYKYNQIISMEYLELNPSLETKKVYWFGIDPVWTLASNQIMVENSIKMKFSIIIGIIHMMFGIVLSLFDHLYFERYYAILLEFVPQLLFLMCIFLYLVFMIFFKWFVYGAKEKDVVLTPGCAPQILILFIDMCLLSKTKPIEADCKAYMFDFQRYLQFGLVAVSVICVPVLLFGSPCYLLYRNKRKIDEIIAQYKISDFRRYQHRRETIAERERKVQAEVAKYNISFGDLMIDQGVSTIEYVLSTISHTASYLRLWALSLAHAELSVMLWNLVLRIALSEHSPFGGPYIAVKFAFWAMFTISIMVVMEGMSAFLHTLRLHWVEFMSKFYNGRGWIFRPFSFAAVLRAAEDEKTDILCKRKAMPHN